MKRPILNLLMVSLISASLVIPAEARLGGGSSGSRSTAVAPRSAVTQPGRVGGGQNVGMQRDQVMNNVRNGTVPPQGQAAQATAGAATPGYSAQPQPAQRSGPGWGTVAGAAAAGAAVGYLAGHSNTPQVVTQAPAQVGTPGVVPAAGYVQPQSSGGSFMPLLIILALIGAGAWFLFRRAGNQAATASASQTGYDASARDFSIPSIGSGSSAGGNARSTLFPRAEQLYRDLQAANASANHGYLRSHCTDALYAELAPSVGAGQTLVNTVSCELVDDSAGMASIRYRAVLTEDGGHPEEVDEVWHFIQQGAEWRLAGIQQV